METIIFNRNFKARAILSLKLGTHTLVENKLSLKKISDFSVNQNISLLEKQIYNNLSDSEFVELRNRSFRRRFFRLQIFKESPGIIKTIEINYLESNKYFNLSFFISSSAFLLNPNYSFKEYRKYFIKYFGSFVFNTTLFRQKKEDKSVKIEGNNGLWVSIKSGNKNIGIDQLSFSFSKDLQKIHNLVQNELMLSNQRSIIQNYFNFPENIKHSCQQYLLYFVQFLKDLGINADSNLKEEAGKILLSVTPTDDIEALDKIREALAIYLNLPASPIVYNDSFAAMRLQQQIENLQHSQRMAARELQFNEKLLTAQSQTLQEKNLTISQQQTVIEQQNKIIEKITSQSIMMDSVENKEELEKIYDGVNVGESKWLKELTGIGLNPAKAIKTAVKNTFGKEGENKSVLGLDEEE